MSSSRFFRLFPPPKLLLQPQVGIDASDDAIRIIGYHERRGRTEIAISDTVELPIGVIDGGEIVNEEEFIRILSERARAYKISHARVSIPEEKAYLFQTSVLGDDMSSIAQNIEFKIETNVPLAASDAIFDFDIFGADQSRASVTVVPHAYIENQVRLYAEAGITITGFETVPHAIIRSIESKNATGTRLIVHVMKEKTGLYIIAGTTAVFTSTVSWGAGGPVADLSREVEKVYSYWSSQESARGEWVKEVHIVGLDAPTVEDGLRSTLGTSVPMIVPVVWANVLDMHGYIPPVSKSDSLSYAVAAGLAIGDQTNA